MTDLQIDTTGSPRIKLAGAAPPKDMLDRLLDLRVDLPLNAPARATMRFYDEDFMLCDDTRIDIAVEVEIAFPDGRGGVPTVFKGEIVAVAVEPGPDGLSELVVDCYDKSHRLTRTTAVTTSVKAKYGELIGKAARAVGLRANVDSAVSSTTHEYLLQSVDDGAALTEIARRTGCQWKVADGTLYVFKPPQGGAKLQLKYGRELIRFRSRFSGAGRNDSVEVRGWDPKSKAKIVGTSGSDPGYLSTAPLAANGRTKARGFGTASRVTGGTVVLSQDEAKEVADAYRSRASSAEIDARGETLGTPDLVPGRPVSITGVGRRVAGDYYVTAVEHVFTMRGYVTRFSAGSLTPSSLADLTAPGGGGGTAANAAPVIGLVSNTNDPDDLGRVKVKFPWLGDTVESEWARVVHPGGGAQRGLTMLPSVNDEVLVVFEHGDTRRPYVVGGLWNGVDKPPLTVSETHQQGKAIRWGIKTAKGDTLMFIEDPSEPRVEITLRDNVTKLVLCKERVELIANSKNLEVKSGQASVLLSQGKDVVIKGLNVTIEGQQAVKINGTQIEVAAKGTLKLSANATAEVTANAKLSLKASGIAEVQGAMVKIN